MDYNNSKIEFKYNKLIDESFDQSLRIYSLNFILNTDIAKGLFYLHLYPLGLWPKIGHYIPNWNPEVMELGYPWLNRMEWKFWFNALHKRPQSLRYITVAGTQQVQFNKFLYLLRNCYLSPKGFLLSQFSFIVKTLFSIFLIHRTRYILFNCQKYGWMNGQAFCL